jgi:hypothetical protein
MQNNAPFFLDRPAIVRAVLLQCTGTEVPGELLAAQKSSRCDGSADVLPALRVFR